MTLPPSPIPPDASRPAASRGRWLCRAFAALVLGVWFFSPVRQAADPTLDTSNYASFAYFTAHGFQFGQEVLHVGGPYGFVHYGFVHGGNLFWKRLPLEFLTKLALGALVVWFFVRHRGAGWRWFWLAMMLTMVPLIDDLPYDSAILFSGLCLLANYPEAGRRFDLVAAALAAFMALLTLIKGTHAMLALITFGLLVGLAFFLGRYRRLGWIFGTYAVTVAGLMAAAGQNPLGFPTFLRSIVEQSAGYNSAMVVIESRGDFLAGVATFIALETLLVVLLLPRWREPATAIGGLLLAGFTFVEWKHGFVRADGHMYIFFHYACFAAPTIMLFGRHGGPERSRWARGGAAGLALVAAGLGLRAMGDDLVGRHVAGMHALLDRGGAAVRQLARPGADKARLDAELAEQRRTYELPLVQNIVGRAPIDFFGTEHGYLTLNRLNYRPRPMGGGNFSVFNAWLQDLNLRHVVARGPEYFLAHIGIFDDRFLGQDDAGTLRALLALYAPIDAEQGMILLRRNAAATMPEPRPLGAQPLRLDEEIALPAVSAGEMLAIELDLPLNWLGRLRAAAYKAPLIYFDLAGEGILQPADRRAVPGLFTRPVILNPVLENTDDLVGLYEGGPGKQARGLRLHTDHPALFAAERFQIRFFAVPRPPAAGERVIARIREKVAHPVTGVKPLLMQPANAAPREFNGLSVLMVDPPGRIRLALDQAPNELHFKFGLDPEAYTRGRTDGVEFLVELERPGQAPQVIFDRFLQPATVPADRGVQRQRVVLPPYPPGSTVSLRSEIGPHQDGGWDWAYFTGIRLLGHGFIPEQFPRFNRIPAAVQADIAGAITTPERDLFMLNAPGSLRFVLTGRETRLQFAAGLMPGAYTQGGQSDGVELVVELRAPDGTVQPLARHLLNPGGNEAHRGDQPFDVPLPPAAAGTELILTITTGPHGNGAWDWSYLAHVDIR